MKISTIKFGDLEIPENNIINMEKPILGFEHLKKYCLIEREDCEPFLWFQSIEEPSVSFLVVNPIIFYPDYRIEVNPKEIEELQVHDVRKVETYVIVTIPQEPTQLSVNLQGPILINTETCLAKQLVMVNSSYHVKHFILNDLDKAMVEKEEVAEVAVPV
jgi:flagellar assembly factor FliW